MARWTPVLEHYGPTHHAPNLELAREQLIARYGSQLVRVESTASLEAAGALRTEDRVKR